MQAGLRASSLGSTSCFCLWEVAGGHSRTVVWGPSKGVVVSLGSGVPGALHSEPLPRGAKPASSPTVSPLPPPGLLEPSGRALLLLLEAAWALQGGGPCAFWYRVTQEDPPAHAACCPLASLPVPLPSLTPVGSGSFSESARLSLVAEQMAEGPR